MMTHVMLTGHDSLDRTGVGTRKVFGYQFRHDMSQGFPLLTTKRMSFRIVVVELMWMLRGLTNISFLNERNVSIWNEWADSEGDLGPIYGHQWRAFDGDYIPGIRTRRTASGAGTDQLAEIFFELRNNPNSRRLVVSAWNPKQISQMKLPPCHLLFQFGAIGNKLNLHMFQRSADLFLGVPYNIAFYGLLLELFAACLRMVPGELVISFTDLHVYLNHFNQVSDQQIRHPKPLATLQFLTVRDYPWQLEFEDVQLNNYTHHPSINAPVAV